jgi:5-methyltetrahydropteroyltriglutamate--homocysteine methyltransferase
VTDGPRILTTTVGSYPIPDWLAASPSEQSLVDATRVAFDLQRQAGIDLPTDGELYRFDVNHPDTNGMIDYFVRRLGGVRCNVGRRDSAAFRAKTEMRFRSKPAGVVVDAVTEGTLNLPDD